MQKWSSLIGIVTAIGGNALIALALNVQRYAHLRLGRRRRELRRRARTDWKRPANSRVAGESSHASDGSWVRDGQHKAGEIVPLLAGLAPVSSRSSDRSWSKPEAAPTYLGDPYWWLGQILITVGEMGNFLAYGFAPASIVSPLGVVALISNCVIAPLFFKEPFRPRDLWGVLVAVSGAVTVVLSAKREETRLGPHQVWAAISTWAFSLYVALTSALMLLLVWLSPRYGHGTILIDLGLVGLFGGYTALATKGVSSMLSSTLFGALATPVTYALLLVLSATAIMQVRYLNKALQRFDSTQVIPIQFVLFTLSVIVGSAVLYGDFERTTAREALKFVVGCLLTFLAVFLITSGRQSRHEDDDEDEDDDQLPDAARVQHIIGMAEQGLDLSRSGSRTTASRRSSRASVGRDMHEPLGMSLPSGWRRHASESSRHPAPVQQPSIDSVMIVGSESRHPRRASTSYQHVEHVEHAEHVEHVEHDEHVDLPSPFSSTVSAVVLLSGSSLQPTSSWRGRPDLREGSLPSPYLFLRRDNDDEDDDDDGGHHASVDELHTGAEHYGHASAGPRARSMSSTMRAMFGRRRTDPGMTDRARLL